MKWLLAIVVLLVGCSNPTTEVKETAASSEVQNTIEQSASDQQILEMKEQIEVLQKEIQLLKEHPALEGKLGKGGDIGEDNKTDIAFWLASNGEGITKQDAVLLDYDAESKSWIVDPVDSIQTDASPGNIVNETEEREPIATRDDCQLFIAGADEPSMNYYPAYTSVEEALEDRTAWEGRLVEIYFLDSEAIAIVKRPQS